MKKMKKFLSMLVAATMTLAMAAPSFADNSSEPTPENGFTLTINDDIEGHDYEAYQIFSGVLAKDENSNYILSDVEWGSGVDKTKLPETEDWNAVDKAASLTEENVKAFALEIKDYLSTTKEEASWNGSATPGEYQFTNLNPGYYLVKQVGNLSDEAYTAYILKVVGNVSATPKKTGTPIFEKKITGELNKATSSYDIGDSVPFELVATMPTDIDQYDTYPITFTDNFSSGLTYNKDAEVFVNGSKVTSDLIDIAKEEKLKVTVKDAKKLVSANQEIVVKYTAKINENATTGNTNTTTNEAELSFPNDPNVGGTGTKGSKEDKVKVFTYGLDLTKVVTGSTTETLSGASFKITRTEGEKSLVATVNDAGKITGWVEFSDDINNASAGTLLTSGNDGKVVVKGLAAGTYNLVEIAAPTGYNKLTSPVTFVITPTLTSDSATKEVSLTALDFTYTIEGTQTSGQGGVSGETDGMIAFNIGNSSGAVLPSTGGIGTTIFYAVGIILMAGAVFFVVRRKRA